MEALKAVSTPFATGSRLVSANHNGEGDNRHKAILSYGLLPHVCHTLHSLQFGLCKPATFAIQLGSDNSPFPSSKTSLAMPPGYSNDGPCIRQTHGDITKSIQPYCDTDYAMDCDRKSISGCVFTLAGSPISWNAKKQKTVAQSTVE
jgi:hypothetical protein